MSSVDHGQRIRSLLLGLHPADGRPEVYDSTGKWGDDNNNDHK
ncbi:MAG: hypothetical protein R3C44_02955 [Chloroflexota bacterium]